MCIVWIGSLSYIVAWMITIIGKLFSRWSRNLIFYKNICLTNIVFRWYTNDTRFSYGDNILSCRNFSARGRFQCHCCETRYWFKIFIFQTVLIKNIAWITFLHAINIKSRCFAGHGSMGISNSIGSNTFDILLCLGLPWLIKASLTPAEPGHYWVRLL